MCRPSGKGGAEHQEMPPWWVCSLTRWSVGRAVLAAVDGHKDPLSLDCSCGQGLISTAQSQVSLCRALYTPWIILWHPHSWTRQSVLFRFHVRGRRPVTAHGLPAVRVAGISLGGA